MKCNSGGLFEMSVLCGDFLIVKMKSFLSHQHHQTGNQLATLVELSFVVWPLQQKVATQFGAPFVMRVVVMC